MSSLLRRSLLFAILAAVSLQAQTQVTFTIAGTVNAAGGGYNASDPLTFTFVMSTASIPVGGFNNPYIYWIRDNTTSLFSSVSATGLTGTWNGTANPGGGVTDDEIVVNTATSPSTLAFQSYTSSGDLRLLSPDATTVNFIYLQDEWTGLSLTNTGISDPVAYFAARTGTYSPVPGQNNSYMDFTAGSITFLPYSLTISAAAIPEPATDAMLAGLGVLSFVFLRRRRKA